MAFSRSIGRRSEIGLADVDDVGIFVNNREDRALEDVPPEAAPQQIPKMSRIYTTEIDKLVRFETCQEYWESLPVVSKLFMFMTLIDVLMVIGYCLWQIIRTVEKDEDSPSEHLHVVLALLLTSVFLIVFVFEAISEENHFELLAGILLIVVIAGRITYFIFQRAQYGKWQSGTAFAVVLIAALMTLFLGFLTYDRFGWRIHSRLACDLRMKHAAERTIIYFTQNRFGTLVKLDFQFLVLTVIMGIVMSVQSTERSVRNDPPTRALVICTGLFFMIGLPWLVAAGYAVSHDLASLARFLSWTCIVTVLPPIGATVSVYTEREKNEATESLLISTILFISFRLSILHYMGKLINLHRVSKQNKSENKDGFPLKFRMSNKNPDLLPLLKGAWLIKKDPNNPKKRRFRFFQLSQDFTTLRWAWNSYVILYYVDDIDFNDNEMTITLKFDIEPDLAVHFEQIQEYEAWKQGFKVVTALLMDPNPEQDLTRESRLRIFRPDKKKVELRIQSFTFEGLLNRFGVTTRRSKHNRFQQHPLPQAQLELRRETESNRRKTSGVAGMAKKERHDLDDPLKRDTSAIPIGRDENYGLDQTTSLDSHGEGSRGSDSVPVSTSSQADESILSGGSHPTVEIIDRSDLELGKFLGAGAEGSVWAAWYLDTPVAVKKTNSIHELEMSMCVGHHDNVVGLRGISKDGESTMIVLEYCPRGTLDVLLHHTMTQSRWDPLKVLTMIRGVARGILHLHSRKPAILHRDIKPANVFVSHGLVLKIGDFGMSRQVKEIPDPVQMPAKGKHMGRSLTAGVIGTATYSAPELLDDRLQSSHYDVDRILKADVYSFGVTLWEIVKRQRPFEGDQLFEIVANWANDPESMKLEPFDIPKNLSPPNQKVLWSLQELMYECTQIQPDKSSPFKMTVFDILLGDPTCGRL